jgi:hypothetical protein
MIPIQPRMSALTRLMPRVSRQMRAVAAGEAHEQLFFEDELLARVIRRGVNPGVHADCIHWAGFDAEAAEDAAQLVDHEALGEALVAAARVAFGILAGFDVNALRGARGRAAQAGHAAA